MYIIVTCDFNNTWLYISVTLFIALKRKLRNCDNIASLVKKMYLNKGTRSFHKIGISLNKWIISFNKGDISLNKGDISLNKGGICLNKGCISLNKGGISLKKRRYQFK